jgi:hypothetical protein
MNGLDGMPDDKLSGSAGVDTCAADPGDVVQGCP